MHLEMRGKSLGLDFSTFDKVGVMLQCFALAASCVGCGKWLIPAGLIFF